MPGLLRIRGVIELDQFWPTGNADADTSKVKVKVNKNSFSFAQDGKTFVTTRVFDDARTVGKSKGPLIDANDRITIRLQGIDAPELHYSAGGLSKSRADVTPEKRAAFNKLNKHDRRQYWAETGTVALTTMLEQHGQAQVPCEVYSYVEQPYRVVDTYGRVVGNIRVGSNFQTDVNVWLVEQGYVFPTFYSSMSNDEIETLLQATKVGKKKKRAWKDLSGDCSVFDPKMVYRPGGPVDEAADRGPLIMPKLFRRRVAYAAEKGAKLTSTSFVEFLKRTPDPCFTLKDFLAASVHSAEERALHEFFKGGVFTLEPQEVVFKEKFSSLIDANGDRIESF